MGFFNAICDLLNVHYVHWAIKVYTINVIIVVIEQFSKITQAINVEKQPITQFLLTCLHYIHFFIFILSAWEKNTNDC